ncbi:MAG: hypothetical protein M3273_08325 [Actinomycetota bacterium]|nr:hypothetical protein [Actinomycetota bacterium]
MTRSMRRSALAGAAVFAVVQLVAPATAFACGDPDEPQCAPSGSAPEYVQCLAEKIVLYDGPLKELPGVLDDCLRR